MKIQEIKQKLTTLQDKLSNFRFKSDVSLKVLTLLNESREYLAEVIEYLELISELEYESPSNKVIRPLDIGE